MLNIGNLKRSMSAMTAIEKCRLMKENLVDQLEVLSPYLPPNTLDELIDELGGPENVAEVCFIITEYQFSFILFMLTLSGTLVP